MNHGVTASIVCPACGQAFLSMQHAMQGVAQCPHCAHSGPRAQFGTHGQTAGLMPVRRRVAQSQPLHPAFEAAPQPMTGHFQTQPQQPSSGLAPVSTPLASAARVMLQPSQALMPVGEPPSPGEFTIPQATGASGWRHAFIMLAFCVVCAAAVWVWWDHANAPVKALTRELVQAAPVPMIQPVPSVPNTASVRPQLPPPDVVAITAEAKALVSELFAADTPERRSACVHDAARHAVEIEAALGPAAVEKVQLRLLSRIPGMPLVLPGGEPVPLYKLVTSRCANGALVRLIMGPDGKRRIDWPMFIETHEGRLAAFLSRGGDETAWFHLGIRPSHGLDIPAELRPKYLTFDAQTSATSDPHFVACIERDTPLGRFLDRESEWGKVYLARLLVRRLDIQADAPCMIVLDCEGAPER